MKKLSKIVVLCLTLILAVGMTFVLSACDEEQTNIKVDTTTKYKVSFLYNYPDVDIYGLDKTNATFASQSVEKGKTATAPTTSPNRIVGYKFDGWYADKAGTEEFDFSVAINAKTEVYAKWSVDNALKLNDNGALKAETVSTKYAGDKDNVLRQTGVWQFQGSNADKSVPSTQFTFTFKSELNNILANKDSYFVVYSDADCTLKVGSSYTNEAVKLENGDNFYYLKVFSKDGQDSIVYTINVYLQPTYTVLLQAEEGNYSTISTKTVNANSKVTAPSITNNGYEQEGWYYYSTEKRNEYGFIVDENNERLVIENGVYYAADNNGNKRFAYTYYDIVTEVDASGNYVEKYVESNVIRIGEKYYKADKKGNKVLDVDGKEIELDKDSLYNIKDETTGLPMYETGTPVTSVGYYLNKWDFDKGIITEDYMHIFCRWTQKTYTIKLTFTDADKTDEYPAQFGGKSVTEEYLTISVKYGTAASTLAEQIKTVTAGYDPTKAYSSFIGWYYGNDDEPYVAANAQGIKDFNLYLDDEYTFYAKFAENKYNIVVKYDDQMGNVIPSRETCSFNESEKTVKLTAQTVIGYKLVEWRKNNETWITADKNGVIDSAPTYTLDINDVNNGSISFEAVFEAKTINVTFKDGMIYANTNYDEDELYKDTTATVRYNSDIIIKGDNRVIPKIEKVSKDKAYLFVGWYYYTDENGKIINAPEDIYQEQDLNRVYIAKFAYNDIELESGYSKWAFNDTGIVLYAGWRSYEFVVTAYRAKLIEASDQMGAIIYDYPDDWEDLPTVVYGDYYFYGQSYVADNDEDVSLSIKTYTNDDDRDIYDFVGWYLVNESSDSPFDITKCTKMDVVDEDSGLNEIIINVAAADIRVIALWGYKPVTVTYKDSYNDLDDEIVPFNQSFDLAIPSNTPSVDQTFDGWYYENVKYTDASGHSVKKITEPSFIVDGIELTAKYVDKNYFRVVDGVIVGLSANAPKDGILTIPFDDSIYKIADNAFDGNETLTSITIKGNIQSIGSEAFKNCKNLTKIIFDGTFKGLTVDKRAFKNCPLETIAFPANTKSLGYGILEGCSGITSMSYSGNEILGTLFSSEMPTITGKTWSPVVQNGTTYYIPYYLKKVTITKTVSTITDYAFENCAIDLIELPETITGIGSYAFAITNSSQNDSLTVNLENVEVIGNYAFYGRNIAKVDFTNLAKLGVASFKNSKGEGLNSITFNEDSLIDTIANNAFEGSEIKCVDLTGIKYINAYAFRGCKGLLTIAENSALGVLSVGERAFENCENIGTDWNNTAKTGSPVETAFKNLETIGAYAFDGTKYFTRSGATGQNKIGNVLYYTTLPTVSGTGIVKIAPYAFKTTATTIDLTGLTSLKIIDSYAFADVKSGFTIKMPSSLERIEAYGFAGSSVKEVNFGDAEKMSTIGKAAFKNCASLTTITFKAVDVSKSNVKLSIFEEAFSGTKLSAIIFPDNLAKIGKYAFKDCTSLSSVTFVSNDNFESSADPSDPSGATMLDPKYDSTGLISVIEEGAFMGCSNLVKVSLPYCIASIGVSAFENCTSLQTFTTVETSGVEFTQKVSLQTIADNAFKNCANLTTVALKSTKNVTKLGASAFENCKKLTSINLESLQVYSDYAFRDCVSLETIDVKSATASVGYETFKNCSALTAFTLNVKSVGDGAFENCACLTTISLTGNNDLATIGSNAFKGCLGLATIEIPKEVEVISDSAFSECRGLINIDFEEGSKLVKVGTAAFANCAILQEVILPEKVQNVGDNAFYGCTKLESVVIMDAVATIGSDAFSLTSDGIVIKIYGTTPAKLNGKLLTEVSSHTILVLEGYKAVYETAWGNTYTFDEFKD